VLRELSNLQNDTNTIVIDTAAGISKMVIDFCLAADHTLVVTTPEATAMTDAYTMIKVLARNKFAGRTSIIVNMAETTAEGKKTYQQIAGVAKRFLNVHVYDAGVLLKDAYVAAAVRQRKPFVLAYPKSQITLSLAALATKLSNSPFQINNEGFFKKVADWFF
jgi:flagellar biosynthesis protein FlhG